MYQKGTTTMAGKSFNPFEMAQAQFDKVADMLNLDSGVRDLLRNTLREYSRGWFGTSPHFPLI